MPRYDIIDQPHEKIPAFLDSETTRVDALMAKVCEGMEKPRKQRSVLLSPTVTDTIDVEEEACNDRQASKGPAS